MGYRAVLEIAQRVGSTTSLEVTLAGAIQQREVLETMISALEDDLSEARSKAQNSELEIARMQSRCKRLQERASQVIVLPKCYLNENFVLWSCVAGQYAIVTAKFSADFHADFHFSRLGLFLSASSSARKHFDPLHLMASSEFNSVAVYCGFIFQRRGFPKTSK